MRVFTDLGAWRSDRRQQRRGGMSLGLVPTMGALHAGHLSLVQRSLAENDRTLVSIFVNPTQFNDPADLAAYPQPLEADLTLLRGAGVHFVVVPQPNALYPDGYRYRIVETERSRVLEGVQRPGHFDGVLTVVLKLLLIADAERAYFGEKDWQQLQLVRGLVDAFFLHTTIVGCPTVRESDGLALSSRNVRLSAEARRKAPGFHRALAEAPSAEIARRMLEDDGFAVEYVEDEPARRLAAVRLAGVRLIDNIPLEDGP
jgi:pantoate--beta-alanine ligase